MSSHPGSAARIGGGFDLVAGARPNFVKIAPLVRAFRAAGLPFRLVHTGQHYDPLLSDVFFAQLELPPPDVHLGVGGGSHAEQTARILAAYDGVLAAAPPRATIVVGDVNSTLACALAAAKRGVPVVHVEAGLRSFDRSMPEEINRVLVDHLADLLFVTEPSGVVNLRREGVAEERIHLVGNVMIDTLRALEPLARQAPGPERWGLEARGYALATLHRPGNVDDPAGLARVVAVLEAVAAELPVLFPVHPRTRDRLCAHGWQGRLAAHPRLRLVEPLGYLDFLRLMMDAAVVLTDSGGVQEETTALGVPCLTLRPNTERPITVEIGTNRLVPLEPDRVRAEVAAVRAGRGKRGRVPELWDGRAAERIAAVLIRWREGNAMAGSWAQA